MTTNLIFQSNDGMWCAETRNRDRIAGSPVATEAAAEQLSRDHDDRNAAARCSREDAVRLLGCDYDPD